MSSSEIDPTCGVAHGAPAERASDRVLVAVFASPVSAYLLRYGADLGFRTALVEPDASRRAEVPADVVVGGFDELDDDVAGPAADVVVTDHHRDELGVVLRDALARPVRWVCRRRRWRGCTGRSAWTSARARRRRSPSRRWPGCWPTAPGAAAASPMPDEPAR